MERIDLGHVTLYLHEFSDGWRYAARLPDDQQPPFDDMTLWTGAYYDGEGFGGFNSRFEAVNDCYSSRLLQPIVF